MTADPKSAELKVHSGRPTIHINGVPQLPFFYALTHSFAGRWSWEEPKQRCLKEMTDAGVRLFQVDMYFEDIWHQDQPDLDIDLVRRQLGGVLNACPDAGIVLRIHTNAPFWWNEAHPEECCAFADGPADWRPGPDEWSHEAGDNERCLRASLASGVWLDEAGERLRELCRRLSQTPEGNSLIGMHVAGGIFGEWHYWGSVTHEPDTGPAMTRYFREWLRATYGTDTTLRDAWGEPGVSLDTARVPGVEPRSTTADGVFRDPSKERHLIDYTFCQQKAVADAIEYLCGIVKREWPRPCITGIFYGYFHRMFSRHVPAGHFLVERLLQSTVVDYFSAPQSYYPDTMQLGGSGNSRGILESALLHGKLWLDEVDNGKLKKEHGEGPYRSIARRCALLPLMRGHGFWYYDFGVGFDGVGWWSSPAILRNAAAEKRLFDRLLDEPHHSVADVLFVWDYDSFAYTATNWTPLSETLIDQTIEDARRSGAVVDEVYLFDLERLDLSRYRAIVFGNAYCVTPEQRRLIESTVAKDGRTVVWNYLAGYSDGARIGLENTATLTGFTLRATTFGEAPGVRVGAHEYALRGVLSPCAVVDDAGAEAMGTCVESGETVIARKTLDSHTSVIATLPMLGPQLYHEVFRTAGCHIYCEDAIALHANAQGILLHMTSGGRRTLRLRNGTACTLDLATPDTVLLDPETGERLLPPLDSTHDG